MRGPGRAVAWLCLGVSACTIEQLVGFDDPPADTTVGGSGTEETGREDLGEMRLDVETAGCEVPPPVSCDHADDDPLRALGLNCPGGPSAKGGYWGHADAIALVRELGTAGTYAAREGEKFVVLSTGVAGQISLTPEQIEMQDKEDPLACPVPLNCPSTSFPGFDFIELPHPIDVRPVHRPPENLWPGGGTQEAQDCHDRPDLVGTGDCSNTLYEQWNAAFDCSPDLPGCAIAFDYAELRLAAAVPAGASGVSFDFAFGTIEYPVFWQSPYNDMFVAWLSSERWTGNISFDDEGHPISQSAGFLDYKDAVPASGCPDDCDAPELEGFALEGHAATRWLNSTAGVAPGETIELVLAIFDLSDGVWDSYAMLDAFEWTCADNPPITRPVP